MMTLGEAKKKTLALIEELNPNSNVLTDDPDLATKHNYVVNQVMHELVRLKKLPKYVEMAVNKGDIIDFAKLGEKCGREVYQLSVVRGIDYELRADNTVIKVLEDGTAEIDLYVFPERITAETSDDHVLELPADLLEILPYGVAADLLRSDISSDYGVYYEKKYETLLSRLDPRNGTTSIYFDGGVI